MYRKSILRRNKSASCSPHRGPRAVPGGRSWGPQHGLQPASVGRAGDTEEQSVLLAASLVTRLATRPPWPPAGRLLPPPRKSQDSALHRHSGPVTPFGFSSRPGRDSSRSHCSGGNVSGSPHRTIEGGPGAPLPRLPWAVCVPTAPGAEGTARGRGHTPCTRNTLNQSGFSAGLPAEAHVQRARHTSPAHDNHCPRGTLARRRTCLGGGSGDGVPAGESGHDGHGWGWARAHATPGALWGGVHAHPPPFTGQAAASWDLATPGLSPGGLWEALSAPRVAPRAAPSGFRSPTAPQTDGGQCRARCGRPSGGSVQPLAGLGGSSGDPGADLPRGSNGRLSEGPGVRAEWRWLTRCVSTP